LPRPPFIMRDARDRDYRLETVNESRDVVVLSDRAATPAEVVTSLAEARQGHPERRVILVFQPAVSSLAAENREPLAAALGHADAILITDIYPSGEALTEDVRVSDLVRAVAEMAPTKTLLYLPDQKDVVGALVWVTHPGDVVLLLGESEIHEVGARFLNAGLTRS
jgi:UDP-N-acetylmuramate--alanine ligase